MRPCPPLLSSLPPTVRAILARNAAAAAPTALTSTSTTTSTTHATSASGSDSSLSDAGASQDDGRVRIKGWVKSVRGHKNVSFAAISDGSTSEVLQAVFKGQNISEQ